MGPRTWLRRACTALAVLYPVCLLGAVLAFRFIGEKWWVTGAALYLPRVGFAAPLPFIAIALSGLRLYKLLWTQLPAILVILFPLMGLALPGRAQTAGSAPVLRVLSYNINSALGGVDNLVEEIERYSPDVVILEEMSSHDRIELALQSRYGSIRVSGQFLVASRFPIVSSYEPEKVTLHGRARSPRFIRVAIETPIGQVALYSVHPLSPREGLQVLRGEGLRRELFSGRLLAGSKARKFKDDADLRTLQVQDFAEAAAREPGPTVIAGDTNLPDLSPILNRYLSAYQDGFAKVGSGFGYTFPTDHGRPPWMRIDRIFANDELRFVKFEVGHSLASDHLCVIADLQRKVQGRE